MRDTSNVSQTHNIPLGAATIVGTVLALSLGDALVKLLGGGGGMGLWQLFAVRSALVLPVLLFGALALFGKQRLIPRSILWVTARSGLLAGMWIAYYVALPFLPLAVAASALYTAPLFIVAFAAVFGRETVGRQQWAGVILGFVGIILVLRPGSEAFQWAALLPIVSAVLYASAMVMTRTKCLNEHPATLALGLNAAFVLVGALGLFIGWSMDLEISGFLSTSWTPLPPDELRNAAILAALILIASVGTAIAYQAAPASTVGTFDFAYVGFAVIWGGVFFGERPDTLAIVGMALIVLAGILAVRRPKEG